jgi:hypothetical protein
MAEATETTQVDTTSGTDLATGDDLLPDAVGEVSADELKGEVDATDAAKDVAKEGDETVAAAEGDDTVAGDGDDKPADKVEEKAPEGEGEKPAEEKPATEQPAAEDPKSVEARAKAVADYAAWQRDMGDTVALLAKGDIDPMEKPEELNKTIRTLAKGVEFAHAAMDSMAQEIQKFEAAKAEDDYWGKTFPKQEPLVPAAKARQIWDEEMTRARGKYKDPGQQNAVATERFNDRLTLVKAAANKGKGNAAPAASATPARTAAAIPGKPKAPVTRGGAQSIPRTGAVPPASKKKTPEEIFDESAGKDILHLLD